MTSRFLLALAALAACEASPIERAHPQPSIAPRLVQPPSLPVHDTAAEAAEADEPTTDDVADVDDEPADVDDEPADDVADVSDQPATDDAANASDVRKVIVVDYDSDCYDTIVDRADVTDDVVDRCPDSPDEGDPDSEGDGCPEIAVEDSGNG